VQEILRFTDPNVPEYAMLKQAAQALDDILSLINERKRRADHQAKILEIEQKLNVRCRSSCVASECASTHDRVR